MNKIVGGVFVVLLLALAIYAAAGFDREVVASWGAVGQEQVANTITRFLGESEVQLARAKGEIAGLETESQRLKGVWAAAEVDLRTATAQASALEGQVGEAKAELSAMRDLVASGKSLADGGGNPLSVADAEAILGSKLAGLGVLERRLEIAGRTVAAYQLTIERARGGVRTLDGEIGVQSEKVKLLQATYELASAYSKVPDPSSIASVEAKIAEASGVIDEMLSAAERNAQILEEMRKINNSPPDQIQLATGAEIAPELLSAIEEATR